MQNLHKILLYWMLVQLEALVGDTSSRLVDLSNGKSVFSLKPRPPSTEEMVHGVVNIVQNFCASLEFQRHN